MSFTIKFDLKGVTELAQGVRDIEKVLEVTQYRAINKVSGVTMTDSRRLIVSQVNLTAAYVRGKMELEQAGPGKLYALIKAEDRQTTLARYGAKQITQPVTWGPGTTWGKRFPRKGDPLRGIPAWRKAAGVSVMVKPGVRKAMPNAFLIPLRGGNGLGVFTKSYKGAPLRHRYGPSVDQVFRGVITDTEVQIGINLENTVMKQLDYEIDLALRKGK